MESDPIFAADSWEGVTLMHVAHDLFLVNGIGSQQPWFP